MMGCFFKVVQQFFLLCGKEQLESDKIHLFAHISQCDFMRIRII